MLTWPKRTSSLPSLNLVPSQDFPISFIITSIHLVAQPQIRFYPSLTLHILLLASPMTPLISKMCSSPLTFLPVPYNPTLSQFPNWSRFYSWQPTIYSSPRTLIGCLQRKITILPKVIFSNLQIQCNIYQNANDIIYRIGTNDSKICMKSKRFEQPKQSQERKTKLEVSHFLISNHTTKLR